MHRDHQTIYPCNESHQDITTRTAFHEAGHAASIYIGNKEKQLPPVFFQIKIKNSSKTENKSYAAKVIDGQLIQHLPVAGLENTQHLSFEEQQSYQSAYEADVVNLLVGPLAEAKFIYQRDNEPFSIHLLNTHALNYYGGSSDVKKAYSYLAHFILSEYLCEQKMQELFLQAFQFIENQNNWACIQNLAEYILNSRKEVLSCEDAVEIFDQTLAA